MKRFLLSFFIALVALTQADATKPKRTDIPSSEPAKGLFVGSASTENPFTMYRQALAEAIVIFDLYYTSYPQVSSQKTDFRQLSLKIINSYVKDDRFFVVAEIKPGTDYTYSVTIQTNSEYRFSIEGECEVCETHTQQLYEVNISSDEMNDVLTYNQEWTSKTKILKK